MEWNISRPGYGVCVCDRSMEGEILLTLILFFLGARSLYRVKLVKGSLAMIKVEKWEFTIHARADARMCVCVCVYVEKAHRKHYGCCACTLIRSGAAPSHELIIRHLYAIPPSTLIARQPPAAFAFLNNGMDLIPGIVSPSLSTRDIKKKKKRNSGRKFI